MQQNTPPGGPLVILTKQQITDAINAYTAILGNSTELVNKFQQGGCYSYTVQQFPYASSHIHAYPALLDGELNFFMIPSHYDTPEYAETFNEYVQPCEVFWTALENDPPPGQEINPATAEQRIQDWNTMYETWIPNRVTAAGPGMFQAFQIGIDDFTEPEVYVHLGLRKITKPTLKYEPDLIVINSDIKTQAVSFDDFVKPVPPFGASAAASSFYLLSL